LYRWRLSGWKLFEWQLSLTRPSDLIRMTPVQLVILIVKVEGRSGADGDYANPLLLHNL